MSYLQNRGLFFLEGMRNREKERKREEMQKRKKDKGERERGRKRERRRWYPFPNLLLLIETLSVPNWWALERGN